MTNYTCTNFGCGCPQEPGPDFRSCGADFRQALELICCGQLQESVDPQAFAFLSSGCILGTGLTEMQDCTGPADNLVHPAGTVQPGGTCGTVSVSGALYPPVPQAEPLCPVCTQAALDNLLAITFDAAGEGEAGDAAYRQIAAVLTGLLRPGYPAEPCCSMAGLLRETAALRPAALAAGPLVITDAVILGQLGSLLVAANDRDRRFYLICADCIDFLG